MKTRLIFIVLILLMAGQVWAFNPDPPMTPREKYLVEENERLRQENVVLKEWIGEKGMKALHKHIDNQYKGTPELRVYPSYPGPRD